MNKSQGAKIAEGKRVAAEGIKAAKEAKIAAQVKAIKMVVFFFLFLLSLVLHVLCYDIFSFYWDDYERLREHHTIK